MPRGYSSARFYYFLAMLERITKFVLKKRVFITLIAIEICGIIAFLWSQAKQNSYPYRGTIIDDKFLDALAMNEFYNTINRALFAFILFSLTGIIFYAIAFVKNKRGALLGSLMFMITALSFTIPTIADLHSRGSERPFVKRELLTNKKVNTYKSGENYYFIFNSGSRYKVPEEMFPLFHIGSIFYTVYQGKSLIHIFPAGKYKLKNE